MAVSYIYMYLYLYTLIPVQGYIQISVVHLTLDGVNGK